MFSLSLSGIVVDSQTTHNFAIRYKCSIKYGNGIFSRRGGIGKLFKLGSIGIFLDFFLLPGWEEFVPILLSCDVTQFGSTSIGT